MMSEKDSFLTPTFQDLKISKELQERLQIKKYIKVPTSFEFQLLWMINSTPQRNIVVKASKGSGKSTCALISLLTRYDPSICGPQFLFISASWDLSIQAMKNFLLLAVDSTSITAELAAPSIIPAVKRDPLTSVAIFGTPTAIHRLIAAHKICTTRLKLIVLDQADLIMAQTQCVYKDESLRVIIKTTQSNPTCQILALSRLTNNHLDAFIHKTEQITGRRYSFFVNPEEPAFYSPIRHYKIIFNHKDEKLPFLTEKLLELKTPALNTIVYVSNLESAINVRTALIDYGYSVYLCHTRLSQDMKCQIINDLQHEFIHVLIALDGLDWVDKSKVNLVVNYDIPVAARHGLLQDNGDLYSMRLEGVGALGHKGGAVFNFLCGEEDQIMMRTYEGLLDVNEVTEVSSVATDEALERVLKAIALA